MIFECSSWGILGKADGENCQPFYILVGKDISLQKNFFYDIMIPVQHVMERCPSGRRCRTRNAVGLIALVGSNPTLSAI